MVALTRRSALDDGPVRFTYGRHPSQYAELTVPVGSAPAPVVVIIHGGYWSASYGAELGRPLAADLVARGFATLNVEYRRVGDGGGWPQTGQDVATAVDALQARSAGLDLNRVVALGHSAGGQLAGWLVAHRGGVALTGAVLQAGVLDLVRGSAEGLGGGAVEAYLGGSPTQVPEAYLGGLTDRTGAVGRAVGLRARHRGHPGADRSVGGLLCGCPRGGRHDRTADVRRKPLRPDHRRHQGLGHVRRRTASADRRMTYTRPSPGDWLGRAWWVLGWCSAGA
ncbi:MAG: lipase/esterase [Mycobacterium sp.]|jgi:acetyl esterase/lipase|nr:lipase/esterase [Mycobacterium sp.]